MPNQLDLDSDNDTIFDLVEAGGTDTDHNGLVDGFLDHDGDGLDDFIAANPLTPPPSNVIKTGVKGAGGCTIRHNAPVDPTLPLALAVAGFGLWSRRKHRLVKKETL
jgi:hypothetical protein